MCSPLLEEMFFERQQLECVCVYVRATTEFGGHNPKNCPKGILGFHIYTYVYIYIYVYTYLYIHIYLYIYYMPLF